MSEYVSRYHFIVNSLLLKTLFLLLLEVSLVIASPASIWLHLHPRKSHSYFTVDLFRLLFLKFLTLKTCTVPSFVVDRVQKWNCHISATTLTSQNLSGTLFFACLSVNMLCLAFANILSWKFIHHTYLLAIYTLNTQRTAYCSV